MKDCQGIELKVGDKIAYCTRRSSWMSQNITTIVDVVDYEVEKSVRTPEHKWETIKTTAQRLRVINPNWNPEGQDRRWGGPIPKHVSLSHSQYIVKVA